MATIKDVLDAELNAARQTVAELEQKIANLPTEIHQLDESVWQKIKAFFGVA